MLIGWKILKVKNWWFLVRKIEGFWYYWQITQSLKIKLTNVTGKMFIKLFLSLNIISRQRMVLPKMQVTQISKEATKHLSCTKSFDFALEEIQTKGHIQEIKERDFDWVPILIGLIVIPNRPQTNLSLQVGNRLTSIHKIQSRKHPLHYVKHKLQTYLWTVRNQ